MKRLLLPLAMTLAGCSATDLMRPARNLYTEGDYQGARNLVAGLIEEEEDDAHLYRLEYGLTAMATGDPDGAIKEWRRSRDRLDELGGRDVLETVGAWLSDDTALDYEGATYERVMVRALLAAAELVAPDRLMGDDALAYALQVGEEQRRIIDELKAGRDDLDGRSLVDPNAAFKFVAFGSYLAAVIREADATTVDAARFQMQRVVDLEPEQEWLRPELERLKKGRFSEDGKGVVHLLALVGRGPFKEEITLDGSQAAFQIAQVILGAVTDSFPQISAKGVPIDRLAYHQDNPTALHIDVDGDDWGFTQTVTDVEEVAAQEHAATLDYRVARAIARRAIKVGITEGARQGVRSVKTDGSTKQEAAAAFAELTVVALGSLWQASETADLRCWSLLPAQCQALRLELEPGDHTITVRPETPEGLLAEPVSIQVRVQPSRPSYVVAVCPSVRSAPTLLSRQATASEPAPPSEGATLP